MAKSKRSEKWHRNKEKVRELRIQKKKDFEASPLLKKAKKHVVIGFIVFLLYFFSWQLFYSTNKAIPTGNIVTGVVVDWAADGPIRGGGELKAKVVLDDGFTFLISLRGVKVGDTLEFNEYEHRLTGNLTYRQKDQ